MAKETQFTDLVDKFNEALGEITPYKLAVVSPGDLEPVHKNAHYMSKRVYDRLTSNVKQDGNLSSLPFCWRRPDGSFVVLSGNHRAKVAAEAKVPLILVLYTDEKLSRSQQVAIQLSHNSLVGQDNPSLLRELWDEIDDLQYKVYSGLDENLLETMDPIDVARINEENLRFEELRILFLSSEIERIQETLTLLGTAAHPRMAARFEDFDRFFDALLDFKEAAEIMNTGTALLAMTEIIEDWLANHKDDNSDPE